MLRGVMVQTRKKSGNKQKWDYSVAHGLNSYEYYIMYST
jgi:hypothetical protein